MKDLIDRQAAIDAADTIIARDTSGNNDVVKAMIAWKEYVKGLPSAQPEIIKCKDCKYNGLSNYCVYRTRLAWITTDNDFCSRAERRTNE